jgi:GNAT superfamily N-acetyltransferase
MLSATRDAIASVTAQVHRRWQGADRLLPAPAPPPPGCGAGFVVTGADGRLVAAGTCQHWEAEAGSLNATWGAARRFSLTAMVAGPGLAGPNQVAGGGVVAGPDLAVDQSAAVGRGAAAGRGAGAGQGAGAGGGPGAGRGTPAPAVLGVASGLDALIGQWRRHLEQVPEAADEDSAAVVAWPSRDTAGVAALVRRGFSPMATIAARTASQEPGAQGPGAQGPGGQGAASGEGGAGAGLTIRRAGPADVGTVTQLGLETIRYDAQFGAVVERPWTAEALRHETAQMLAEPRPWAWLAERDGRPAGMLSAERPAAAAWIAPMTGRSPVAYLLLAAVLPGERGTGTGAALAARAHREFDAAGVEVTLLHYAQANPLSVPFWSREGYRPLWTNWVAQPASTIR